MRRTCVVAMAMIFIVAGAYAQSYRTVDTKSALYEPESGTRLIPRVVSYQGYLTDTLGNPITDTFSMTFAIYDALSGGNQWWTETQDVVVENGIFGALLGNLSPIPDSVFRDGIERWLQMTVEGEVLTPRARIASAGYAYTATHSDTADYALNALTGDDGDWTILGSNLYSTVSGNVGIGTSSPSHKLHVRTATGNTFIGVDRALDELGGIAFEEAGTSQWIFPFFRGWQSDNLIMRDEANNRDVMTLEQGTGYVGVGTIDPEYRLDVRGNRIQLKEDATGDWIAMRTDGGALDFQFEGGDLYVQSTTDSQDILLNPNRNSYVGIGTTSPEAKLAISAPEDTDLISFETSGTNRFSIAAHGSGTDYLSVKSKLENPDSTIAVFSANGRVGIRTTNPDATLHVINHDPGGIHGEYYNRENHGHLGTDEYGVEGYGTAPPAVYGFGAGGYFELDYSGQSATAYTAMYLKDSEEDPVIVGVGGYGYTAGGYFKDNNSTSYAYVGSSTYKILGNGSVSFVQNHPEESDRVIVYACPEGDEVATYTRGTARLVNGIAHAPLGETFKWVTNPDIGLTAHLTPRGEAIPLAVVSLTTEELVVKGPENGPQNLAFDYIVYGLRKGFEEVSIVQEKRMDAPIPSMADHYEQYSKHPDLKAYNALERFKAMETANPLGESRN